jgi:hypothetical protein
MEISKINYNKLLELTDEYKNNKDYELESRIYNSKFRNNDNKDSLINTISYNRFMNVLNYFIKTEEEGGMGKKYDILYTLRTTNKSTNIRLEIEGIDEIKLYWVKNKITKEIKYKYVEKSKKEIIDIEEYNLRFCLNREKLINKTDEENEENIKRTNDKTENKMIRYKNTYRIYYDSCRIDMSIVKMGEYRDFREFDFNMVPIYEIEVEANNKGVDKKKIVEELLEINGTIIMLLQGGNELKKVTEIIESYKEYKKLIEINKVKENNNKNQNQLEFIAANPVSLSKSNLRDTKEGISILNDYAVTIKADGERHLLYIDNKGSGYLIDVNLLFKPIKLEETKDYKDTIIEGEWVEDDNIYLPYDILYYKGEDVRSNPLELSNIDKKTGKRSRLNYLKDVINKIKSEEMIILMKDYLFGNGEKIFENIKYLWDNRMDASYNVDGLIFVPVKENYPIKSGAWHNLLKWKPIEYTTIDFLIETVKEDYNDIKVDKIFPYIKLSRIPGIPSKTIRYKKVKLMISKVREEYNKNNKKWLKIIEPGLFSPEGMDDKYTEANIEIDENGIMYSEDPVTKHRDIINDNTIVEFRFEKENDIFYWRPIRVRYDKTEQYKNGAKIYGNYEKTAYDIWKKINNPISEYSITTGEIEGEDNINEIEINENEVLNMSKKDNKNINNSGRLDILKFHNLYVKTNLIIENSPGGKQEIKRDGEPLLMGALLDLVVGKGSDMLKWVKANLKKVIGIDNNKMNIDYCINNYKTLPRPKPDTNFIWGDIRRLVFPNYEMGLNKVQELKLKEYITNKYSFDIITCFFTLQQYYEDEYSIRGIFQNITDNLKMNGKFVSTILNGRKVFEKLLKEKEIEGKDEKEDKLIWSIHKEYRNKTYDINKPNYNYEIEFYLNNNGNEIRIKENLVNIEYIIKLAEEYGLELEINKDFEEIYKEKENKYKLSEKEKELSFMYNALVFKKIKIASDKVFTKYYTLLKKHNKEEEKKKEQTINLNMYKKQEDYIEE